MKLPNIARKALALACAAAIAALSVLGLVGCGPSAEELIKQALTADLDAVKNVDEDTVKAALGDETLSEMESYGIDPYEFYTNCVKNFSYDNLSVKVEGDSATVTLDATNVDIEQVMSTWQQDCYTYMLSQEAMDDYTSMGESGMMKKLFGQLTDAIGASDAPTKTENVQIDFKKGDNGWDVADESQLTNIVFAGADLSSIGGDL